MKKGLLAFVSLSAFVLSCLFVVAYYLPGAAIAGDMENNIVVARQMRVTMINDGFCPSGDCYQDPKIQRFVLRVKEDRRKLFTPVFMAPMFAKTIRNADDFLSEFGDPASDPAEER